MTTSTASLLDILDSDHEKSGRHKDLFTQEADLSSIAREVLPIGGWEIPKLIGEFWTSGQRQACSLHEISYRACFKPQLPRYFIKRFSAPGDLVYDPFGGRGTTAIEAALMGRQVVSNDANPLSDILTRPRLSLPTYRMVEERLGSIQYQRGLKADIDLSMFYDPATEAEIVSLRDYLHDRKEKKQEDAVDRWIRMVATNRLTGHSLGFFSVYTFPPNQAVSPESQVRINERRKQKPEYRDTKQIILKKTASLLARVSTEQRRNITEAGGTALLLTRYARDTREIATESIQLTVTSPPFLDIVQYASDNWLRCWFNGLDADAIAPRITMSRTLDEWNAQMARVFAELHRLTKRGGWVAFEVGEVRKGKIRLEEHIIPLGIDAGFNCEALLINQQRFTKTANIWGVGNNRLGTNTNRIVVFRKSC